MKLLLCKKCNSIFNLDYEIKKCKCGETEGKYLDELNAVYSGVNAIPLGIANYSFAKAIVSQPEEGLGSRFEAFVIPKECETFIKKEEIN